MPGVSRVNQDTAGGTIIGDLAPTVFVNGKPVAVLDAHIKDHGDDDHAAAVMVGSSSTVYANNIKICRQGDSASCGHTASGSGNVFAG